LEDTIQTISLPKPLHKDESEDEAILYTSQTTTLKLNNSAKLPKRNTRQLLTPGRMVSPELNTALQGLQDHVSNTVEPISTQQSSPEPPNRAINTTPCVNKISAKPFTDLILLKGFK
jgi:hypothetical protein